MWSLRVKVVSIFCATVFCLVIGASGQEEEKQPVHLIGIDKADSIISVRQGERIKLSLPAAPGTGYGWSVVQVDTEILKSAGQPVFESRETEGKVGATEQQIFLFDAQKKGITELVLVEKRVWEEQINRSFSVTIRVD